MFLSIFFLLLALACFHGLTRDEGVAGFIIVIGFAQDPARKLIAGEPVVMTIMVGVVVACIALRRLLLDQRSFAEPFTKWTGQISGPLGIFLAIIAIQGVHSFVRYGSMVLTGLGAIFYIAPLVAIVVGYSQFHRFEPIRTFLLTFCVFAIITASSIFASYLGVESDFLGEVGSGLIIYDQGTILKAYSGLMRSSEIASWHMGACVCFLVILIVDRGSMPTLIITVLAISALMGAIILTGRRKMILQIVIFSSMYFPILKYYQGRLSTRFVSVALMAFVLLTVVYSLTPSFEGTDYDLYVARGASVFEDAGERFSSLGIGSLSWAYQQHGFFGGGLGIAAQGSQHFIEGEIGGAGEGGIGKLVSELGLVSIIFIAWLGLAFALHVHKCLRLVAAAVPDKLPFSVGLLVFLMANLPTFIVASQVFGDVFVLVMLGFLTGALFAIPKQVQTRLDTQNQAKLHNGQFAQAT